MKELIIRIVNFLAAPFSSNLRYLISWMILVLPAAIYYSFFYHIPSYGFYIFINDLVSTYLLCLLIPLLTNRSLQKIYIIFITAYYCIFSLCDVFCLSCFDTSFGINEAAVLIETNESEASSMLNMFFNYKFFLYQALIFAASYLSYRLLRKHDFGNKYIAFIALGLMAYFFLSGLGHLDAMAQGPIIKPVKMVWSIDKQPSSEQMRTNPKVSRTVRPPQKVVLIIGESLSKNHCQVYGYEKCTNPNLKRLVDNGSIVTFADVTSADVHTTGCFKKMLTTYNDKSTDKWYRYPSIIEIVQQCGIYTKWISGQEERGIYDNDVTSLARLCDDTEFVKSTDNRYDGKVIPVIKAKLDSVPSLDIIHLMGCHESFVERYPGDFNKFDPSDYNLKSPKHNKAVAEYDNSVLYNDWVVSQIIDLYKDDEAIIFYFPDHSLDIYDSGDDYIGHARHLSNKSYEACSRIPFMIYFSESFKNNFPDLVRRISDSHEKPFNLDNLVYTIMDVYGIRFDDNNDVQQKSLFSK